MSGKEHVERKKKARVMSIVYKVMQLRKAQAFRFFLPTLVVLKESLAVLFLMHVGCRPIILSKKFTFPL